MCHLSNGQWPRHDSFAMAHILISTFLAFLFLFFHFHDSKNLSTPGNSSFAGISMASADKKRRSLASFLDASSHLYKRACPSVRPSALPPRFKKPMMIFLSMCQRTLKPISFCGVDVSTVSLFRSAQKHQRRSPSDKWGIQGFFVFDVYFEIRAGKRVDTIKLQHSPLKSFPVV